MILIMYLLTSTAYAHCNPMYYNGLYRRILEKAVLGEITQDQRNEMIETIRELCFGQKSYLERGVYEKEELPKVRKTIQKRRQP